MSDAADRLAQALRDLINEAVEAAIERERPPPPPARVVERPKVPEEDFELKRQVRGPCVIQDTSTKDRDWIPVVASSGWVAITRDADIQSHLSLLQLVKQYQLRLVTLTGADAGAPWVNWELLSRNGIRSNRSPPAPGRLSWPQPEQASEKLTLTTRLHASETDKLAAASDHLGVAGTTAKDYFDPYR